MKKTSNMATKEISMTSPEVRETFNDPYIAAREEYYDRYGRLTKDLARWRLISFFMLLLVLVCIGATVYMAFTVKVIPYIIQVDKHGYEIAIQPAPRASQTDDRVIISRLARFIIDMRTIIADPAAQRRIITSLYTMIPSGQSSYMKINDYFRNNNPLELASKGQTQEVEIRSILHLEGNTWQTEWIEKRYERGTMTDEKTWRGFITVAFSPQVDLKNVIDNPLGIYVLDFNFAPNF